MVYGPSSLAVNSKPDAKSNGIKYGVFEATDHSVALAGTLVCICFLFLMMFPLLRKDRLDFSFRLIKLLLMSVLPPRSSGRLIIASIENSLHPTLMRRL